MDAPTSQPFRDAQRRPGHQPRRHSPPLDWNNPVNRFAQRRPGHQPRRHRGGGQLRGGSLSGRSTKAGASTPATQYSSSSRYRGTQRAQRRPGHQPRRHVVLGMCVSSMVAARSTKAGASTPATRSSLVTFGCQTMLCAQRRPGINPGDTWLLTAWGWHVLSAQRRPGHQPRRHRILRSNPNVVYPRSTKAGASTPATPRELTAWVVRTIIDAQRRPGHQPRRHKTT